MINQFLAYYISKRQPQGPPGTQQYHDMQISVTGQHQHLPGYVYELESSGFKLIIDLFFFAQYCIVLVFSHFTR